MRGMGGMGPGGFRGMGLHIDRTILDDVEPDESISLKTVWAVLKEDVSRNKWYVVADCLLIFAATGLGFLQPSITRRLIDSAIPAKDLRQVTILAAFMVAVAFSSRAIAAVMSLVRTKFNYLVQSGLQARALRSALEAPLNLTSRMATGDVLTVVTSDSTALVLGLGGIFRNLVGSSYSLVLAAILLWRTSPLMLLLVTVASGLRFPIQRWMARTLKDQNRARQTWFGRSSTTVVESMSGINTVKVYGLEDQRRESFVDTLKRAFAETFTLEKKIQFQSTLDTLLNSVVPAAIYGYGGYLVVAGRSTIGSVLAAIQYMTFGLNSFGGLIGLYAQFKPLFVHMERLQNVLSLPSEYGSGFAPGFTAVESMEFSDITFKHDQQAETLLQGVSLALKRGEITGLVGPSGGGKTTMAYLATGVFRPIEGSVRVEGEDARGLSMKWYRERVALVTDSDFIFTGTILENLKIVRPGASGGEVQRCLYMSLFDRVVADLPQGLDTAVGRTGVALSSGQRQRLSLARAILRDPQVVVLDEITSNLDPELERHLHERLDEWMRQRVVLLISHRISTILWADRVFELRDGRLAERTGPFNWEEAGDSPAHPPTVAPGGSDSPVPTSDKPSTPPAGRYPGRAGGQRRSPGRP